MTALLFERRCVWRCFGRLDLCSTFCASFALKYLCPPFSSIRAIDADIKKKTETIDRVDSESKDYKDSMAVMVEHLKNVQQEVVNTQQLIEAKTKEVGHQGEEKLSLFSRCSLFYMLCESKHKLYERTSAPPLMRSAAQSRSNTRAAYGNIFILDVVLS